MFTGDEFADGAHKIIDVFDRQKVRGSFFFTGRFYRNPAFYHPITELKQKGHFLGAHSDGHLLYNDWTKRDSLLVTHKEFENDLLANYRELERFGVKKSDAPYFLPPYEWYNKTISNWTSGMGLTLVNFSPGTRSTADYTWPEMGKGYLDTETIYQSILQKERTDPNGLNGFILLVHYGTDPRRTDKLYDRLDQLIVFLKSKGYRFKRIDELLAENE